MCLLCIDESPQSKRPRTDSPTTTQREQTEPPTTFSLRNLTSTEFDNILRRVPVDRVIYSMIQGVFSNTDQTLYHELSNAFRVFRPATWDEDDVNGFATQAHPTPPLIGTDALAALSLVAQAPIIKFRAGPQGEIMGAQMVVANQNAFTITGVNFISSLQLPNSNIWVNKPIPVILEYSTARNDIQYNSLLPNP